MLIRMSTNIWNKHQHSML